MLSDDRILTTVGTPIAENQKMWRYVRLSALLMLLEKRVYIPSIERLRLVDPTESAFFSKQTEYYLNNLPEEQRRLLGQRCDYREGELQKKFGTPEMLKLTLRWVWERELCRLRCAWCWYGADIESMAMWNLYAHDGVAIATTVSKIEKCLEESHSVTKGIIGAVEYVDDPTPDLSEAFLRRPYLIKQRCYQHEHEIRVILPKAPEDTCHGLLLDSVDPNTLLTEIQLSPHMELSESCAVIESISKLMPKEIPIYRSMAKQVVRTNWEHWTHIRRPEAQVSCFGEESTIPEFSDPMLRDM